MDTSTYFGLNLVTGSDKVNPLTIDRPNYEKIDEQMHKNQIASVVEAAELKSGSVHAITCLTENAVFFRFTATSDYTAGDTFTYNGTPVTAVLPDGSGLLTGAFKINGTVLCSIVGTLLTVYSFAAGGTASDSEKLGGQLPSYYAPAVNGVTEYTHSKIGTVNNFVGSGSNGKVKFSANINSGDTVQINGIPASAFIGTEDFVTAVNGKNIAGKTFYFITDGTNVWFSGGVNNDPVPVWTNSSPRTSFAGQTVSLNLSGYTHVLVKGKQASGNGFTSHVLVAVGESSSLSLIWQQGGKLWAYERAVIVSASGVQFGDGEDATASSVSTNNNVMVPVKIWGVNLK